MAASTSPDLPEAIARPVPSGPRLVFELTWSLAPPDGLDGRLLKSWDALLQDWKREASHRKPADWPEWVPPPGVWVVSKSGWAATPAVATDHDRCKWVLADSCRRVVGPAAATFEEALEKAIDQAQVQGYFNGIERFRWPPGSSIEDPEPLFEYDFKKALEEWRSESRPEPEAPEDFVYEVVDLRKGGLGFRPPVIVKVGEEAVRVTGSDGEYEDFAKSFGYQRDADHAIHLFGHDGRVILAPIDVDRYRDRVAQWIPGPRLSFESDAEMHGFLRDLCKGDH